MKENSPAPYKDLAKKMFNDGKEFVAGKIQILIWTHPIQVALNLQQAQPGLKILPAFSKTFDQPLRIFGKSLFSGLVGESIKGAYKAPVMMQSNNAARYIIRSSLPEYTHNSKILENVAAGFIYAYGTAILSPIDRMKIFFTTSEKGSQGFIDYIRKSDSVLEMIRKPYEGASASALKQFVTMSLLFTFNTWCNKLADKIFTPEQSKLHKGFCSLGSAGGICLFVVPVDFVKTRMQMNGSTSLSMSQIVSQTLKESGPKGLYKGAGLKAVQLMIGHTYTAYFINNNADSPSRH